MDRRTSKRHASTVVVATVHTIEASDVLSRWYLTLAAQNDLPSESLSSTRARPTRTSSPEGAG